MHVMKWNEGNKFAIKCQIILKDCHVEHVWYDNVAKEDLSKTTRPKARLLHQVLYHIENFVQGEGFEEQCQEQSHVAAVVEVVKVEQQGRLAVLLRKM